MEVNEGEGDVLLGFSVKRYLGNDSGLLMFNCCEGLQVISLSLSLSLSHTHTHTHTHTQVCTAVFVGPLH